ncbi:MAG: hypothetical protein ACC628_17090, partial [Pirellulaceae bacterium]
LERLKFRQRFRLLVPAYIFMNNPGGQEHERTSVMRATSLVAPGWWDYTTLDREILDDAARLGVEEIEGLSREGFTVQMYDTIEEFYLAEALEYISAWRQATEDQPTGVCGPIGPTEQLPLVARLVNELDLNLRHGHFWGMDEWFLEGREAPEDFPLSFARADRELLFNRIRPELSMQERNIHFPKADTRKYVESWNHARCIVMQGGQGEVKHWAFNDPPERKPPYDQEPPSPEEYRQLATRVVDLHPMTVIQNARTSGGGVVTNVPQQAVTVGPVETWQAEKVSIWQAGQHDNPFGQRLTAWMISKKIPDASVPMSLLADHPNVQFNYLRSGIGICDVEMH